MKIIIFPYIFLFNLLYIALFNLVWQHARSKAFLSHFHKAFSTYLFVLIPTKVFHLQVSGRIKTSSIPIPKRTLSSLPFNVWSPHLFLNLYSHDSSFSLFSFLLSPLLFSCLCHILQKSQLYGSKTQLDSPTLTKSILL